MNSKYAVDMNDNCFDYYPDNLYRVVYDVFDVNEEVKCKYLIVVCVNEYHSIIQFFSSQYYEEPDWAWEGGEPQEWWYRMPDKNFLAVYNLIGDLLDSVIRGEATDDGKPNEDIEPE